MQRSFTLIPISLKFTPCETSHINSLDAGDGIFQLWGYNTMHADALAPKVNGASADMVLAV